MGDAMRGWDAQCWWGGGDDVHEMMMAWHLVIGDGHKPLLQSSWRGEAYMASWRHYK